MTATRKQARAALPTTARGARAYCLRWASACLRCAMITSPGLRRRPDVQNARAWIRQARGYNEEARLP